MACRAKPTDERVGDRDDLHHAGVDEPLHALAHGRLGQPDGLADGGVRTATVLLQLLDDRLGDIVEHDPVAVAPLPSRHGRAILPLVAGKHK